MCGVTKNSQDKKDLDIILQEISAENKEEKYINIFSPKEKGIDKCLRNVQIEYSGRLCSLWIRTIF